MNKLTLLNFLTVLKCPSCDEIFELGKEGNGVLCRNCNSKFEEERQRTCNYCGMSAQNCRCIPKNIKSAGCNTFVKITFYDPNSDGVTEKIILHQKDYKNRYLSKFFANKMVAALISAVPDISDTDMNHVMITYAPRSKKALNEKGFDQAEIIAGFCAKKLKCRFAKLIKRTYFSKQQKNLDVSERTENAKRSFKLKNINITDISTVIIVDDIVTTGSSLSACVNLLKQAGVEQVICLAVAQTNKKG